RQGSTRVPLDKATLRDLVRGLLGGDDDRRIDDTVAEILRVVGADGAQAGLGGLGGGLVGRAGEVRPLVVDDGCLYQHRLWWLETRLAGWIAVRLAAPPLDGAEAIARATEPA